MALISVPFTFTVGAVIVASQHNSCFSVIYSDYNGNITTANIAANAAIVDTQLAQITTAGKLSGAAFTVLGSIPTGAGTIPSKNGGTGGDLSAALIGADPYFSATGVMSALAAGTSGQVKVSQGGAAPIWANALSSVSDYGTSTSSSTSRQATAIKIAYGTISSITGGSSVSLSNLPFSSSTSYVITATAKGSGGVDETPGQIEVSQSSGSAATVYTTDDAGHSYAVNWIAIGV